MQGLGETFGRVTIEAMAFGLPVSNQLFLGQISHCYPVYFFQRFYINQKHTTKRLLHRNLRSLALFTDSVIFTMI